MTDSGRSRQSGVEPGLVEIETRFDSVREFEQAMAPYLASDGIFLPTGDPLPASTVVRFRFLLPDDLVLFEGTGVVFWTREVAAGPEAPAGMALRFAAMASRSQDVIDRLVQSHQERGGIPFNLDSGAGGDDAEEVPEDKPRPAAGGPEKARLVVRDHGQPASAAEGPPAESPPPEPPPSQGELFATAEPSAAFEGGFEVDPGAMEETVTVPESQDEPPAVAPPGPADADPTPLPQPPSADTDPQWDPSDVPPAPAGFDARPPAPRDEPEDLGFEPVDEQVPPDEAPGPEAPGTEAETPPTEPVAPTTPLSSSLPPLDDGPLLPEPELGPDESRPTWSAEEPPPTTAPPPSADDLDDMSWLPEPPQEQSGVAMAGGEADLAEARGSAPAGGRAAPRSGGRGWLWLVAALVFVAAAAAVWWFLGPVLGLRDAGGTAPVVAEQTGSTAEPQPGEPVASGAGDAAEHAGDEAAAADAAGDGENASPVGEDVDPVVDSPLDLAGQPTEGDDGPPTEPTAESAPPANPTAVATRIEEISWRESAAGTVVTLQANGRLEPSRVALIPMASPPRLLIRLRYIEARYRVYTMDVTTPEVSAIRTGLHPELDPPALYVVLDLTSPDVAVAEHGFDGSRLRVEVAR